MDSGERQKRGHFDRSMVLPRAAAMENVPTNGIYGKADAQFLLCSKRLRPIAAIN